LQNFTQKIKFNSSQVTHFPNSAKTASYIIKKEKKKKEKKDILFLGGFQSIPRGSSNYAYASEDSVSASSSHSLSTMIFLSLKIDVDLTQIFSRGIEIQSYLSVTRALYHQIH
jgi:hypothetical protein